MEKRLSEVRKASEEATPLFETYKKQARPSGTEIQ